MQLLTAWTSNLLNQLVPSYTSINPYAAALKSLPKISDDVRFGHQPGPAGIAVAQSQSSGKVTINLVRDMAATKVENDGCAVVQQGVAWTPLHDLYATHQPCPHSPHAVIVLKASCPPLRHGMSVQMKQSYIFGVMLRCAIGGIDIKSRVLLQCVSQLR
jgi:hypothetical protein